MEKNKKYDFEICFILVELLLIGGTIYNFMFWIK